ncbi:transglutaminase-like domain-containing protein [Kibdelosporangium persicum]|uniref:Aminotransferase n=1 Tax=Kibdelosporangium persicum TaxID=2698649 RepID=A0ABX2F6R1_9PSEU|nr:transglutaminase-like domain-containing protein [Kibdelosporangium persicum]NRN67039.1 Aminotransferase [Kibdelosporangium persicum]
MVIGPTEFLDYEHERVRAFVGKAIGDATTPKDCAVRLFYAVRDGLDYEVSGQDLSREGLRASSIVARGQGFCVHKSILYAAAVRSVGIPSRLVVSEVRNHLASPALKALVGGDTFVHWLTAIRLDGRWLHVTPVFNKVLCRLYRMEPLEFDGESDARLHPFTDGERMEFLTEHGRFDDVDYDRLMGLMRTRHPGMFANGTVVPDSGSLAAQATSV